MTETEVLDILHKYNLVTKQTVTNNLKDYTDVYGTIRRTRANNQASSGTSDIGTIANTLVGEQVLVNGTVTITHEDITEDSIVTIVPSTVGTLTGTLKFTLSDNTLIVSSRDSSNVVVTTDTCLFHYTIQINNNNTIRRNQIIEYVPPAYTLYALKLDGTNDALQSGSVSLWERTQAFTFQLFITEYTQLSANVALYDTRNDSLRGILIFITSANKLSIQISSSSSNRLTVDTVNTVPTNIEHIAITYDGSSNASNIKIYFDGVLQSVSVVSNSLTTTIAATNTITIGNRNTTISSVTYPSMTFKELTILNLEKTITQIGDDITAGTQLILSGTFLVNLKSIYSTDNSGQISTLDSTVAINSTPNFTILGKDNPMVLGVDLIAL